MADADKTARRGLRALLLGAFSLSSVACTGLIADVAGPSDDAERDSSRANATDPHEDDASGSLNPDEPSPGDPDEAGLRPLRRLTEEEYNRTLRSLLHDDALPYESLGGDAEGDHGFALAGIDVPVQRILEISERLAERAKANLSSLDSCDRAVDGEDVCAERFVRSFGRRAYRRTLVDDEVTELLALYRVARDQLAADYVGALGMLITAMLESPRFLYHWQAGAEVRRQGDVVRLDGFELASRLSYFLWGDMPDDALLDAAERGALDDDDALSREVDRMLRDARAAHAVQSFHTQWLALGSLAGLNKDPVLFPEWSDDLKRAMAEETKRFVADVFGHEQVPLEALFSAHYTYVNESLARVYGIEGVTGEELVRVDLDDTQRGGLLTQPGVIASQANPGTTNPARAGKMVFANLLCQTVAPPPPGAALGFQMDPTKSTRENFERLEVLPSCGGCHQRLNPLGYAFEHYDAIGRYRTLDGMHAVDASGVFASSAGDVIFDDLVGLGAALAETPELRECVARKWTRFALGRTETNADRYSLDAAFKAFDASRYDVKRFLKSFATSRTFRCRAPETGEMP